MMRSFIDFLETVLSAEASLRDERRREVLMRMAAFPSVKTLEQVEFEAAADVPKARIQELGGLAFIKRRENVVFLGRVAPAKALWRPRPGCAGEGGRKRRYNGRFVTAADLVLQIEKAHREYRLE